MMIVSEQSFTCLIGQSYFAGLLYGRIFGQIEVNVFNVYYISYICGTNDVCTTCQKLREGEFLLQIDEVRTYVC